MSRIFAMTVVQGILQSAPTSKKHVPASTTSINESRCCPVIEPNCQQQHEQRVDKFFNPLKSISVYRRSFFCRPREVDGQEWQPDAISEGQVQEMHCNCAFKERYNAMSHNQQRIYSE